MIAIVGTRLGSHGSSSWRCSASPSWVTDEPAGEDFPGADFNAHETRGVVTVGTASSGDMTAGLDRDHGQTGDYWYLDTQPGHSYRVEVTFGASTGISTGGSAGIAFLDPDGVDYASSCCESDHNREDSYTFVHFTHSRQSREWNRSYMVKVAAFDLYNEGTAVYNGPYLITMTDITGVQQMVHSFSGGTTHPATDLLESGEDTGDIAVSFRTGSHSDGYTLDRIKVLFNHIPAGGATQIVALHPDVSGSPGNTQECYLRTSLIAESAVAWSYTPPHTFLATFCASVTLTANTTYWIVFPMTNRNDEVVALATIQMSRTTGRAGMWSVLAGEPPPPGWYKPTLRAGSGSGRRRTRCSPTPCSQPTPTPTASSSTTARSPTPTPPSTPSSPSTTTCPSSTPSRARESRSPATRSMARSPTRRCDARIAVFATATTDGIEDEDGLMGPVFAYQRCIQIEEDNTN